MAGLFAGAQKLLGVRGPSRLQDDADRVRARDPRHGVRHVSGQRDAEFGALAGPVRVAKAHSRGSDPAALGFAARRLRVRAPDGRARHQAHAADVVPPDDRRGRAVASGNVRPRQGSHRRVVCGGRAQDCRQSRGAECPESLFQTSGTLSGDRLAQCRRPARGGGAVPRPRAPKARRALPRRRNHGPQRDGPVGRGPQVPRHGPRDCVCGVHPAQHLRGGRHRGLHRPPPVAGHDGRGRGAVPRLGASVVGFFQRDGAQGPARPGGARRRGDLAR
ncbi:hypothetical protein DYB25_001429 [Aphanomyces astaci]|uniref:Uncharacterized protein n=1 Tax=Aphanomyces astaci TaxID=112090 RepID=A0A397A1I4_APHAT|nr:hypothetical protein DYB25_001429 [Aphanomyces astaci]